MIDKNLFFGILFGFATLYLSIGVWAAHKVRTLKSYFLADRNLGVFKLTFTLVATQLGSGLLLGTSQRAYNIGLWGLCYTIGLSLGFIILACGFASRMRSLNIATTAEIFETHYGSSKLKLFASGLSILSLWGILLAQIIASKMLFLSLGIDDPYILATFWGFLIFYTMLGGLGSVVIIDAIQVILIISVFTYLLISAFKTLPIAPQKLLQPKMLSKIQHHFFEKRLNFEAFLPTLLMPTLFSLIEQDLAQRFFAAKTRITATLSAFFASAMIIGFSCIPIFFGIYAKVKHITIPQGASPLLPAITHISGQFIFILAICSIIAAITSTADSLLSAISSNIAQDFQAFLPMERQKLFMSRLICFLTGVSALVTSFFITNDIISVIENSYRVSVICLFIPTVIAYFFKNLNSLAAWISILCGIAGFIASLFLIQTPIFKDLIPLGCSLFGYLVTIMIFKKK